MWPGGRANVHLNRNLLDVVKIIPTAGCIDKKVFRQMSKMLGPDDGSVIPRQESFLASK